MSESAGTAAPVSGPSSPGAAESRNPFVRVITYIRQVVAELKKVIWPTRQELITYTTVVLVFVAVMGLIVSGFDFVFTKAVLAVFGK